MTVLMSVVSIEQCYWSSTSYVYFGGKTLYDDVRGDIRRHQTTLAGCTPASMWLLARHGARHPSEPNIRDMKAAMELRKDILNGFFKGRGKIWDKDIVDLQEWSWNTYIDASPYILTSRGARELRQLGNRINETFYTQLKKLTVHSIRPTNEQRTIESARNFVKGLDYKLGYEILPPLDENKDFMLLPYKNCELHSRDSWNGPERKTALQRYANSSEYRQLLERLQERLGLEEPLTRANVTGLYDLCRFYRSLSDNESTPWCKLFSTQDLMVLEYMEDINHYYRSGYGISHNKRLGKLVLADLLKKFQAAAYHSKPSFTAYFSHDSLIDMVYGALGLYRDEEGLSVCWRNPRRLWRTSLITPFAANILAVFHKCEDSYDNKQPKVQFFANEIPLKVCEESNTCSWTEFENKLKPFLNSTLDFCRL